MERTKVWAVAGWSLLGCALLAGAGQRGELRLRRLVIEDAQGRERIALEMSGDEPTISITDDQGDLRYIASASDRSSVLTMRAGKNGNEMKLAVGARTPPCIDFQNGKVINTVDGVR